MKETLEKNEISEPTMVQILEKFELNLQEKKDEHDLSNELLALANRENNESEFKLKAELLALGFEETNPENSAWNKYFGPAMVMRNEDNTFSESPSFRYITPEIIDYWKSRAEVSMSPLLRSRYLGLIWDFEFDVCKTKPGHEICRSCINALVELVEKKRCKYDVTAFKKLEKALELSLFLNDSSLIELVKQAVEVLPFLG